LLVAKDVARSSLDVFFLDDRQHRSRRRERRLRPLSSRLALPASLAPFPYLLAPPLVFFATRPTRIRQDRRSQTPDARTYHSHHLRRHPEPCLQLAPPSPSRPPLLRWPLPHPPFPRLLAPLTLPSRAQSPFARRRRPTATWTSPSLRNPPTSNPPPTLTTPGRPTPPPVPLCPAPFS